MKKLVGFVLVCAGLPVFAQQTDPLLEQLQQLKQQYADTTRALEQRIAALEQQITEQKQNSAKAREGTISTAELAAEEAANTNGSGGESKSKWERNFKVNCRQSPPTIY